VKIKQKFINRTIAGTVTILAILGSIPEVIQAKNAWSSYSNTSENIGLDIRLKQRGQIRPETSQRVVQTKRQNMGGGYSEVEATLYRDGSLRIQGSAIATERTQGVRATVNVVGYDRRGNTLFVSQPLDIPTACGKWDPSCSSRASGLSNQNISPEIAKYISHLHLEFSERQGPDIFQRTTQLIRQTCTSYNYLPVAARAAIAYQTGFPGCNF